MGALIFESLPQKRSPQASLHLRTYILSMAKDTKAYYSFVHYEVALHELLGWFAATKASKFLVTILQYVTAERQEILVSSL